MSANLENSEWPQDWKMSVFIPIPKKGNVKECSNYWTIVLISHASKVKFKIIQARLQKYVTENFQIYKLDLEEAARIHRTVQKDLHDPNNHDGV